jgi:hypothetical protein
MEKFGADGNGSAEFLEPIGIIMFSMGTVRNALHHMEKPGTPGITA